LGNGACASDSNQLAVGSNFAPLSTTPVAGSAQGRYLIVNVNGVLGKVQLFDL
jgi:hypothetical protein